MRANNITQREMSARVPMLDRRFGRLVVVKEIAPLATTPHVRRFAAICDCGQHVEAQGSNLRSGGVTSCGCAREKIEIVIGERFDRWVVMGKAPRNRQGMAMAHVVCDCGTKSMVAVSSLRDNTSRSCGCLRADVARQLSTKHGCTAGRTPDSSRIVTVEFTAWMNLRRRCEDPSYEHFADYGGRGIRVCDRWRESFESFLKDMGARPSPDHSSLRCRMGQHHRDFSPKNLLKASGEVARRDGADQAVGGHH